MVTVAVSRSSHRSAQTSDGRSPAVVLSRRNTAPGSVRDATCPCPRPADHQRRVERYPAPPRRNPQHPGQDHVDVADPVHPKVVSELLGHATIALTLDTYSHVIPSLRQEAADVVAAAVLDPAASTLALSPPKGQVRAITSGS
jgi:hypothetical protein